MSAISALNQLCKWRTVLAGWHRGTAALTDSGGVPTPGVPAMRDLMDKWLIMRAETNAMMQIMLKKKIVTPQEIDDQIEIEARLLDEQMAKVFPGFRSSPHGITIYDARLADATTHRLGFPP
jgi:hypothetical protein